MRNLKKILALALALVMALSLMGVASASSFTDADQVTDAYSEAVEVLSGLGVFKGTTTTTTTFSPKQTITRAEVAAIIYRIATGDVDDAQVGIYKDYGNFKDVKSTAWYAGYVGYCANAGYILGDGTGKFNPNDTVTGYQALAMILRAVGYDANGEFTGSTWQVKVASTANELGITDTVTAGTLGTGASREVVAELLFRTIVYAPIVKYTTAFGYQPVTTIATVNVIVGTTTLAVSAQTLGQKTFGLKQTEVDSIDNWCRPGYTWTATKPASVAGTVATIAFTPVYTTKVRVDECDIAEAIGLTRAAAIENAYIDGVKYTNTDAAVTTNRYATINPLATTSYVGAQGRITEIYDMGGTYRIVEINTYLAQVAGVTAATTDKNGHVTPGYSTLTVYTNATTNVHTNTNVGVISTASDSSVTNSVTAYSSDTSFAVGSYVLVTANGTTMANSRVATIEQATPVASGALTGYTASTTTIGGVTVPYNNADKFELNNPGTLGTVYDVYVDANGNIIGLVKSVTNYLVIERIEWEHDNVLGGGYVLADVVLSSGDRVQNVTVATVGGVPVSCSDTASPSYGSAISDRFSLNTDFYDHLITYSVNSDGSYNLLAKCNNNADEPNTAVDASSMVITKTQSTITSAVNTIVANDNTVFLVKDTSTGTYTTYVGKDNVPSMTNATICYLLGGGFAKVVVVTSYDNPTNTFLAYVTTNASTGVNSRLGTSYSVYKLGETTATTVYDDADGTTDFVFTHETGLYQIVVNSDYQIQSMTPIVCDGGDNTCAASYGTQWGALGIDRAVATTGVVGSVFITGAYTNMTFSGSGATYAYSVTLSGSANKDFVVNSSTKFITATIDETGTTSVVELTDGGTVAANDVVLVSYTTTPAADASATSVYTATCVYIIKAGTDVVNQPTTPVNVTGITIKDDKSVYLTLSSDASVGTTYAFELYKLDSNGYVSVGTFNATVQGNTKGAWVDLSSILANGTYKVVCGAYTDVRTF